MRGRVMVERPSLVTWSTSWSSQDKKGHPRRESLSSIPVDYVSSRRKVDMKEMQEDEATQAGRGLGPGVAMAGWQLT